jgi:hypothetical protein
MIHARLFFVFIFGLLVVAWFLGPVARLGAAMFVLLLVPGILIERLLRDRLADAPLVRVVTWLGLSASCIVLLYQWLTAFNIALTTDAWYGLVILSLAGLLWVGIRNTPYRPIARSTYPIAWEQAVPLICLVGVFGVTVWVRFVQIEGLALPAWVDSVHHALMIRVAIEKGQAPISLLPYLPVERLPYHWGYHVITAALVQLSDVPIPQVMLWQGQILNALHVLAVGALASYLWRRPWAAVAAGIIVGVISIMPAYYVSWGRYTQLTGLLLVPPLAVHWDVLLRTGRRQPVVIIALLLAGLSLIHFRMLVFALVLMLVLAGFWAIYQPRAVITQRLGLVALAAGVAGSLTLPWLWLLVQRRLLPAVEQPRMLISDTSYSALNQGLLWAGQNRLLVALALLSVLWSLHRRAHTAIVMLGWICAMAVLANPWMLTYILPALGASIGVVAMQRRNIIAALAGATLVLCNPLLVRLPSSWLITNDVVVICLFLPIAVAIAGPAGNIAEYLYSGGAAVKRAFGLTLTHFSRAALIATIIAITWWGAQQSQSVLNPSTVLATSADLAAIDWVSNNTPPDARFLINATGWLPSADRGVDGGWWLLPLTGRWTSTPPVIFDYGPRPYVQATRARTNRVAGFSEGQEQVIYQLIEHEQIDYIYLGAKPGALTRATFADAQRFTPVYEHDGVLILAVRP